MKKKQRSTVIWILIWAGLFILIQRSFFGSTESYYTTQNYYAINQNQNDPSFIKKILNAPKVEKVYDSNDFEISMPNFNSDTKTNYAASNYHSTNSLSQVSSYTVHPQTYQNSNTGSVGFSELASANSANRWSRNSEGSSGIVMTNGITSMSTTTDLNSSTSHQSAFEDNDPITGGPDPGPIVDGDPLPVGDGWGLLGLFGVCYLVFKMKVSIGRNILFHLAKMKR